MLSFARHLCFLQWFCFQQDNAERTSSFVVLINLLRPLDPSRWPSPTPTESLAVKNQKFSDLVVKCLIKLTKVRDYLPALISTGHYFWQSVFHLRFFRVQFMKLILIEFFRASIFIYKNWEWKKYVEGLLCLVQLFYYFFGICVYIDTLYNL